MTPVPSPDVLKVPETHSDGDIPRRGSLCDRHCAAINNVQGDLGCHQHHPRGHAGRMCRVGGGALGVPCSVSPLFCPLSPAVSSPLCCQQHSEEVCESCVVKTTLTAENAVEANKLSNNYKVGSHRAGRGGISWIPSGFSHLKISLSTVRLQEMEEPHYSTAMGRPLRDCQRALL